MYTQYDLSAVPQAEFLDAKKAANTITKYWPKTTVTTDTGEEVSVLGQFTIYDGAVNNAAYAKKLYPIVGTSYNTLKDEEWKGVESAYFNFTYTDFEAATVTGDEIHRELTRTTTETRYATQTVVLTAVFDKPLTEAELNDLRIAIATGSTVGKKWVSDNTKDPKSVGQFNEMREGYVDRRWPIAFADVDEVLFDRSVVLSTPVYKAASAPLTTTDMRNQKYYKVSGIGGWTYAITITFTMKKEPHKKVAVTYDALYQKVKENDIWSITFRHTRLAINGDVENTTINGVKIYAKVTNYAGDVTYHLRADAFMKIKTKHMAKFFKQVLNFDYVEEPVPWYVKLLVAIVIIIIVIVAVIFAIPSGGTSIYGAIAAIAGVIALAATAISLVLQVYAGWLESTGRYKQAQAIGRVIVVLNDIAKYAGYVAMVAGLAGSISAYAAQGTSTAASAGANVGTSSAAGSTTAAGAKAATTGAVKTAATVTTSTLVKQGFNVVNTIVGEIINYKMDQDAEEEQDAQEEIAEQARIDEEYYPDTAATMAKKEAARDNNISYEQLTQLDVAVYEMTQGNITGKFNKYY